MADKQPFIVLDKTTNKSKHHHKRSDSSGSSSSSTSSPARSRDSSPAHPYLKDRVSSAGGFTVILSEGGGAAEKAVFVFPSKKLSPLQREQHVREFIAKLYNVSGDLAAPKIDEIIDNLIPNKTPTQCNKIHLQEVSQARNLAENVELLPPSDIFKTPTPKLAPSTPGPRISKVPNLNTPHTPEDSLRIINHLGLSDDDCRYVRGISMIGLSSEHSVKKLRSGLLGNGGQGWGKSEKISVKKWFRDKNIELKNRVDGSQSGRKLLSVESQKQT